MKHALLAWAHIIHTSSCEIIYSGHLTCSTGRLALETHLHHRPSPVFLVVAYTI